MKQPYDQELLLMRPNDDLAFDKSRGHSFLHFLLLFFFFNDKNFQMQIVCVCNCARCRKLNIQLVLNNLSLSMLLKSDLQVEDCVQM